MTVVSRIRLAVDFFVGFRELIFDHLTGDLEYHPKRAVLYFALAVIALSVWIFTPDERKRAVTPLVLGCGSLTLFLKGIFLLRKTSDGFQLSGRGLDLSERGAGQKPASKTLPPVPIVLGQIVQDFGAGSLLVAAGVRMFHDVDHSPTDLPLGALVVTGALLFIAGWFIRLTSSSYSMHP